jgi:hypothetical protein
LLAAVGGGDGDGVTGKKVRRLRRDYEKKVLWARRFSNGFK